MYNKNYKILMKKIEEDTSTPYCEEFSVRTVRKSEVSQANSSLYKRETGGTQRRDRAPEA